nr:immunoglobulin light chain junction region [Macaca mulatta]
DYYCAIWNSSASGFF